MPAETSPTETALQDLLEAFFCRKLDQDFIAFGVNIPKKWHMSANEWALYAQKINNTDWMGATGVALQRTEMASLPTIKKLAKAIRIKIEKHAKQILHPPLVAFAQDVKSRAII